MVKTFASAKVLLFFDICKKKRKNHYLLFKGMRLHISTIKEELRKYIIYKIYNIVLYINLGLFSGRHWLHVGFDCRFTVAWPSFDRRSKYLIRVQRYKKYLEYANMREWKMNEKRIFCYQTSKKEQVGENQRAIWLPY